MSDHIDRAAEVLFRWNVRHGPYFVIGGGHFFDTDDPYKPIARALDDAGLLAKYPRLEIEGDWLIEVVDYHTCGAGPGSGAGHEPGCGSIPVARLASPEHDAAVAAEWADHFEICQGTVGTEPLTVESMIAALRGPRPFGREAGEPDADA